MEDNERQSITAHLQRYNEGAEGASDALLLAVYDELRKLAGGHMRREGAEHTLQATALVHELWTKLAKANGEVQWPSRGQFFQWASTAMRHYLCDYARAKKSKKSGGDFLRISLEGLELARSQEDPSGVIDFADALEELAELNPRMSSVVELRSLAGLSYADISSTLDLSEKQVNRTLHAARIWLQTRLSDPSDGPPPPPRSGT